ncbi:uncharacterized protein LOC100908907 [Galendromus occidentalis]|uniref:Uncharacterized protein LOC100900673 n=1 Tax=Galendromus occidentalis TaxID=34638 RepID=A0AAJ7PAX8_9ACAR|nr:uncharacterized protein LOC100900673 [Galendromus occidentalis]XP_018497124.1 uncharacterized protein LOC100908907 [Galendromus occidentalis]
MQPPKSGSTLRKYLKEDADVVRDQMRAILKGIIEGGYKLAMSFDEATVVGTDRYITVNVHHHAVLLGNSKILPLGLIRIDDRQTGSNLCDLISGRLRGVGLSTEDFAAASTDGASNVRRALDLMLIKQQKCFAHGLDLVVRKTIYGRNALAFDIDILLADRGDDVPEETENGVSDDTFRDSLDETEVDADLGTTAVCLGAVIDRLRSACREFKRKPIMMDEIRKTTRKEEFNGRELRPILDCRTRWYSTCLMIERALRILPALNNVLSRHGTPISATDVSALEQIADALIPFKRAILMLCKKEATLLTADKLCILLLSDLRKIDTELATLLRENFVAEILKRRSIFSSVLSILSDPSCSFDLEKEIGQGIPSDLAIIEVLEEILPSRSSAPLRHSVVEEPEELVLTWQTVYAEPTASSSPRSSPPLCTKGTLERDLTLFKAGGGRSQALTLCKEILEAIPPTSVQPERDFSVLRLMLGENRTSFSPETLDDIFILKKKFQYDD